MDKTYTKADLLEKDIEQNKEEICELDNKKVDKVDFNPVKSIVYGLVGLILTSVAVALISSIITK